MGREYGALPLAAAGSDGIVKLAIPLHLLPGQGAGYSAIAAGSGEVWLANESAVRSDLLFQALAPTFRMREFSSRLRRWMPSLAAGLGIGLELALGLGLSGCAAPMKPDRAGAEQLAAARVVAVRFGLTEAVSFGYQDFNLLLGQTRGLYGAVPGHWGANKQLLNDLQAGIVASGRQARILEGPPLSALQPVEQQPRADVLVGLSRAMSKEMAMADDTSERGSPAADVNLIVAPLGLDPRGIAASPGVTLLTRGFRGLAADSYLGFRTGYMVSPGAGPMNLFSPASNLVCSSGYNMVVTDARTHTLLYASGDRVTHVGIPDEVPRLAYRELTPEQKAIVGRSCVSALAAFLKEDLAASGLMAEGRGAH